MSISQFFLKGICALCRNITYKYPLLLVLLLTDCYDIKMKIVNKHIGVIVKPQAIILNKSFSTGVFPDGMKTAKVVPIFKS